jgi:hypothetical protein
VSDVIISLVRILKNNHHGVRSTAVELVKALIHYGALFFRLSLLPLTDLIDDIRISIVKGHAIHSVVNMLKDNDDGVKKTVARLLRDFSLEGGLLFDSLF